MTSRPITRQRLLAHSEAYPRMQVTDLFKYLFQSAFGCEHLVASEDAAVAYIRRELAATEDGRGTTPADLAADRLDGAYSRVPIAWLRAGLTPETLGKLFCRSAKIEPNGREELLAKLDVAREMIEAGELPFPTEIFDREAAAWRESGYPAIHHSEAFRAAYRPAYRVIAQDYVRFLPFFACMDRKLQEMAETPLIVAIEGGSASGKTTLAQLLSELYDCNVFHMDDFFLRPEQRTAARFAEIGGNVDRERFLEEVLRPACGGETVSYRPFDCATQTLGQAVTVPHKRLTIVEGAYSMHPALAPYYHLSVFLDVDPACQRERILRRNSPTFAKRFFEEWIPMEVTYASHTAVRERCGLCIRIAQEA